MMLENTKILIEKIQMLSPEKAVTVADFVDFLQFKDQEHTLTSRAARANIPAFAAVWDNPDDEAYDAL
jgi:hypothetical protein